MLNILVKQTRLIKCRGKFPPLAPSASKNSQNVLPEFLIFHSFFCTNIPRNGTEDCVKCLSSIHHRKVARRQWRLSGNDRRGAENRKWQSENARTS